MIVPYLWGEEGKNLFISSQGEAREERNRPGFDFFLVR